MCTLLLLRRPAPGWRLLFLENRDHPGDLVLGDEMRLMEEGVVGHYDVRSDGLVCGYSLRTGLVAGLANIPGPRGPRSRGEAMRTLLTRARSLDDGLALLTSRVSTGDYSPAVYVLGDADRTFRVESLGARVDVVEDGPRAWSTNHFREQQGLEPPGTRDRAGRVEELLRRPVLTPEDLLAAASEHEGSGALCRHGGPGGGWTLSSALVAVPETGPPRFWFAPGPPCERPFREFPLPA